MTDKDAELLRDMVSALNQLYDNCTEELDCKACIFHDACLCVSDFPPSRWTKENLNLLDYLVENYIKEYCGDV